jgi:2,4-dienoyl-CoA reductase-like NADH-dependent reductase (Old Yellow Enzyme family)
VHVFEPAWIGRVELSNRIVRSATFEGRCDAGGRPGPAYLGFYRKLSAQGLGALITGFAYVSPDGRAMQPGQAGMDSDDKVAAYRQVTRATHENGCRIFLQLAHAGRQTVSAATGGRIYAPSSIRSPYFNQRPCQLTEPEIKRIIDNFADAARRAGDAGFDGVQIHAAHGYLVHQFLHPACNDRNDIYGIDPASGIGTVFLHRIIERIRLICGTHYPLLIKVSSGDSSRRPMTQSQFIHLVRFLDQNRLDAIEVSYGTMDRALDIFRGESVPLEAILDFNPRYRAKGALKRLFWRTCLLPWLKRSSIPFTPMYNLAAARLAKEHTSIPIISVGGFRRGSHIRSAIEDQGIDFVSLCRPILCEPDFVKKLRRDEDYQSRCANCNRCAIMCDSGYPTHCYENRRKNHLDHPIQHGGQRRHYPPQQPAPRSSPGLVRHLNGY